MDLIKGNDAKEAPPKKVENRRIPKEHWTVKSQDKDGRFYTAGSMVIFADGVGSLRLFNNPDVIFHVTRK
jgi:hypothetical protein